MKLSLSKLSRLNTLRNQMLFGFLFVMLLILGGVAYVTFNSVAAMLNHNAEKNIEQTAIQANGRLEEMLQQINSISTQVATNAYVQQLLLSEKNGTNATFAERQKLPPIVDLVQLYTRGVKSVELYSFSGRKLFPLDGSRLQDKIKDEWISDTFTGNGSLVWFGNDPGDPESIVAMRLVKLMDQDFAPGGYLVVRLYRNLFQFMDSTWGSEVQNRMVLAADDGTLIAANTPKLESSEVAALESSSGQTLRIGSLSYLLVRQRSDITGWTLFILTPIDEITRGISLLRDSIVVSAGVGFVLFVILSIVLSAIIMKPILRLIRTMRGARFGMLRPVEMMNSTNEIYELNRSYNEMVDNINDLIRLVYEKELLRSRTELKALQAQINPHFLFNTLEVLYRSLCDKDETELAEFVIALSDLFRYTITKHNKDEWVALGDEMEHVERYLLIMKTRHGDRLTWKIDCSPDLLAHRVPKLLVQPIVENAVSHGVENKIGPGFIAIEVFLANQGEDLVVQVTDNGAGMDGETLRKVKDALDNGDVPSAKGSGLGIANVQRRVQLIYRDTPRTGQVEISSEIGKGTRVRIVVPFR